ncbi:Accelerated cell death 11 [Abeliophyllum distichum]|uniref:Accelerated cell death 11 n=1 Tax=Abeliophyllum distichum TaxID=126358 RepID=A0ABD1Q090_9LAMI
MGKKNPGSNWAPSLWLVLSSLLCFAALALPSSSPNSIMSLKWMLLPEASKSISTLEVMMDRDIDSNCVRKPGSHTRNLLRVKRGIDMVRVLFEQIVASEGNSLKDAASKAYAQVLAPHHGWAIRKAVGAGMYALPTKSQLLKKLNEDEVSAKIQMQNYIASSIPVIIYIDKLFNSRKLGINW